MQHKSKQYNEKKGQDGDQCLAVWVNCYIRDAKPPTDKQLKFSKSMATRQNLA